MNNYFTKLLGPNLSTPDDMKVEKSRQWFREQAAQVENLNTRDIIRGATKLYTNRMRLGHFYLFRYEPMNAMTLPYYDRFPYVLVLNGNSNSFMGLNMHYLPFEYRAVLMDQLHNYTVGDDDMARIRITYQILQTTKRLRFYKPCLRQYLNNYVTSRLVHVEEKEWDIGMFLPLQRFVKKRESAVHRESIRQIRNLR